MTRETRDDIQARLEELDKQLAGRATLYRLMGGRPRSPTSSSAYAQSKSDPFWNWCETKDRP